MIQNKMDYLSLRIEMISDEMRTLQTKIDVYSSFDRFAMEIHQTKYMELDMQCLDLMTELQELQTILALQYGVKLEEAID